MRHGALEEERDKLQSEMEVVVELTQNCMAENARTAQNQEEYQKRYNGLMERYEKVKTKYDIIVAAKKTAGTFRDTWDVH